MDNQNQQPLTKDELTYALKEERGELVKLIKQEISLPIGEKIDKMAGQIESIQTHQLKQDTKIDKMAGQIESLQGHALKQDIKIDKVREDLERRIDKSENAILNSNDKLMAELKKKNEEEAAHSLSHIQIKNNLANHEHRLHALEPQAL